MGIQTGETVGAMLVISKDNGECLVRCRCDKEFSILEDALLGVRNIIAHRHRVPFPPYTCRCRYEVAYWTAFNQEIQSRSSGLAAAKASSPVNSPATHSVVAKKVTSGMSDVAEYQTWWSLIDGCHNPDSDRYKSLGRKRFSVCKRWRNSFDNFLNDLGRRPTPNHMLFIRPGSFQYNQHSTRWVTREEWAVLQPHAALRTYNGTEKSIAQWAEYFSERNGLPPYTNRQRIVRGWSWERMLTGYQKRRLSLADQAIEPEQPELCNSESYEI